MKRFSSSLVFGFLFSTAISADNDRHFSSDVSSDEKPTIEKPCVLTEYYESILVTVPYASQILPLPDGVGKDWTVVINKKDGSGTSSNLAFCTGEYAGRYPNHPLFQDPSGDIYTYDYKTNTPILAWSLLEIDSSGNQIWMDHLNNIVWGAAISEIVSNENGEQIQRRRLMNLPDSMRNAEKYETSEFPAGSWRMPTHADYTRSNSAGLRMIVPGFLTHDRRMSSNWSPGYGNYYWMLKNEADGLEGLDYKLRFIGKSYNGAQTLKSGLFVSWFINHDEAYIRYVLRSDYIRRAQDIADRR